MPKPKTTTENTCTACGAQIPEGIMVCKRCDDFGKIDPDNFEECPLRYERSDDERSNK